MIAEKPSPNSSRAMLLNSIMQDKYARPLLISKIESKESKKIERTRLKDKDSNRFRISLRNKNKIKMNFKNKKLP